MGLQIIAMSFTLPWFLELRPTLRPLQLTVLSHLQEVDWEVELAVIIGKKGKHIKVRWKGTPRPGRSSSPKSSLPVPNSSGAVLHRGVFGTFTPLPFTHHR